jgi:tetratricopeptide (TPR) repeat protein
VHNKPDDLGSRVKLAEFYEYWRDKRRAVAIYDEICTSMPDTAAGCAGAGRILFDQKRFAEAESYLQKAFDRDPADQNNAALLQRAISLAQQ